MGKLKEVKNQTHQWIKRKNPNQLTREKRIFSKGILGINPQLRRAQRKEVLGLN